MGSPRAEHYYELFEYSIAHLKEKRLATAQAFWAMSFESYIESKYCQIFKTNYKPDMYIMIKEMCEKVTFKTNLHDLRGMRNKIVHERFMDKEQFTDCLNSFMKLFDDENTIDDISKIVDTERQTELALNFKDRVFYDDDEFQLMKYSKIEESDFYNGSELEKRIWNLKYVIKARFDKDEKAKELEVGLISDFGISSEWIWLPVGFDISEGNMRVKKEVISILIFRDRKIRIYLDFGTSAIEPRKEYYKLLETNGLNEKLKSLVLNNAEKNFVFWNVKHYSILEKTDISINDWLAGKNRAEVSSLIREEKENWTYRANRGNILLFGFEERIETESIEELAEICVNHVYELVPFLKAINRKVKGV